MQEEGNKRFIATIKSVYKTEGLLALYRGIAAPLVSLPILNALNFSTYSIFKWCLGVRSDKLQPFDTRVPFAATAVGPLASIISTPFELVKTRMQLQKHYTPPPLVDRSTVFHMYTILATQGVTGLYVGHVINTARETVFLATYFTVYEYSKSMASDYAPKVIAVPLSGGLSGAISWFVSFPLDSVKTHIQKDIDRYSQPSSLNIFRQIVSKGGLLGLYSGLGPSILRAFVVSSTRFSVYEAAMYTQGSKQ